MFNLGKTLRYALGAAALSFAVSAVTTPSPAVADGTKIVFSTDWGYNGRHAYYFTALKKGYYAEEGLDVEILGGRGSGTVIKEVAAGTLDIGFADSGTLAIARANENVPVKLVAVVYADSPHALIVLKDSGIKNAKDLEGKTLSDAAGSSNYKLFPAYARAGGADPAKAEWVFSESTALVGLLLSGKVDAIGQFSVGAPLLAKRAAPKEISVLHYKDAPGFEIYSNGIIVREDTLKEKPEMVKKFVRASMKGLRDAINNPQETAEIMKSYHRQVETDITVGEIGMVGGIAENDMTAKHGLGYIDEKKLQSTIDLAASVFEFKRPLKAAEMYVSGFTGDIK